MSIWNCGLSRPWKRFSLPVFRMRFLRYNNGVHDRERKVNQKPVFADIKRRRNHFR